jgi:hypothetical protein
MKANLESNRQIRTKWFRSKESLTYELIIYCLMTILFVIFPAISYRHSLISGIYIAVVILA